MSQMGQTRRFHRVDGMSVVPSIAAVMLPCRERQKGANNGLWFIGRIAFDPQRERPLRANDGETSEF